MSPRLKYLVTAQCWTPELETRFGENLSVHRLDAEQVMAVIEAHGPVAMHKVQLPVRAVATNTVQVLTVLNGAALLEESRAWTCSYQVTATCWSVALAERFGAEGSVHHLTNADVVAAILTYGPAVIEYRADDSDNIVANRVEVDRSLTFVKDEP